MKGRGREMEGILIRGGRGRKGKGEKRMKGRGRAMEGILIRGGREVKGGEEKREREGPPGYYGFPRIKGC